MALAMAMTLAILPAMGQNSEVPHVLSYQGQLVVDGQPVSGSETIRFELYSQPEGGSPLGGWREDRTVNVQDGIFSVLLGEQQPIPPTVFEQNGNVYLSVRVNGSEIRMPLVSTPFSFRARSAVQADRAAFADEVDGVSDGSVTGEALADGVAVRSLNDLTDQVSLVEGSNISISTNEQEGTIEISAVGGQNGGLTSVSTDDTIDGDGTSNNPLGLAPNSVGSDELLDGTAVRSLAGLSDEVSLEGENIDISVDGQTIVFTAQAGANGGLTSVNTDGTLTGDGTAGNALGIADGAIVRSLNGQTDTVVLEAGDNVNIDADDGTIVISAQTSNGGEDAGVSTLNELTGDITIVGGRQIGVSVDGQEIIVEQSPGSPSSLRYKDNVQSIVEAVLLVQKLEGVQFAWKNDGGVDLGLIAEDVAEILPQVVYYDESTEEVEGINYNGIVALLLEALKEQQDTISLLRQGLDEQRYRLDRLEQLVERE